MIRDIGIDERVNVKEPQRRKKRTAEKQQRGKRPARPATEEPGRSQERKESGGIQVLPPHIAAHLPSRINEYEADRPQKLAQIKTGRMACDEKSLDRS